MMRKNRSCGAIPSRRGITMIEALILVTCVGLLLGLAAVTIQVMLRLVAESRSRLSSSLVLERLAETLRADAHDSDTAALEGVPALAPSPPRSLKLIREPGWVVTYKLQANSVDRDETLAGKRLRHESFVLARGQHARFQLGAEAGRATVSILVEPGDKTAPTGPARILELLAVVGKHRGAPVAKVEKTSQ
jgi:type II secretory pathway pseudopilin PulG